MPTFLTQVTGTPVDPPAATAGVRTLGTGSQQAAAGNDSRLSDARTPTAHAASHAVGGSDVLTPAAIGLGNVDNTSNATERAATRTLTNARVTKRIGTTASSSTPTADADSHDAYTVTAAAANMTVGAPTGTPTEFQPLVFRFKDNGTARTIAWNAVFRPIGVTLPTTTVANKTLYVGAWWNSSASAWDVTAVGQES